MNSSPVRILIWSQWLKVRPFMLTTLGLIAIAYGTLKFLDARGFRKGAGEVTDDFLIAALFFAVPAIAHAASILLIHSDADRLELGLPQNLKRLPLATWKLVAILLGFAVATTFIVATAASLPSLWLLNAGFEWYIPVFGAMLIVPLLQLWAFTFGDAAPRIAGGSFIACFGALAWLIQRPRLAQLPAEMGTLGLVAMLAFLLAALFGLTVQVARVKRAGGPTSRLAVLDIGTRPTRAPRRFKSPRAAQFWYEWRLFGNLLPLYVTGVALVYFIGLPLIVGVFRLSNSTGQSSREPLFAISWYTSAQFLTTGLGLAAIIGGVVVGGIMFMRAGHWNSSSSYLLTRPLSIRRLASARIKVMFASTVVTLLLLTTALASLSGIIALLGETLSMVDYLQQGYQHLPAIVSILFFWAGIFLAMWLGSWSISFVWVVCVVALVHLPSLAIIWILSLTGRLPAADAQTLSLAAVTVCNWIATGLLALGLLWMAHRSLARNLLAPYATWLAAGMWLIYGSLFVVFATAWKVPPGAEEWFTHFPHPVDWSLWLGISILPIAPLFLHPILLERARHR